MNMVTILNLVKMELIELKKPLIYLVAFFVIFNGLVGSDFNFVLLIMLGFIYFSSLFWQFKHSASLQSYLVLSSSALEKVISKFLLCFGYVAATLLISFLSIYSTGIFDYYFNFFEGVTGSKLSEMQYVYGDIIWLNFYKYHGFFVLASIVFGRSAFAKTLLVLSLYSILLLFFKVGLYALTSDQSYSGFIDALNGLNNIDNPTIDAFEHFANFLSLYILPLGCWVASYFVLKNREA